MCVCEKERKRERDQRQTDLNPWTSTVIPLLIHSRPNFNSCIFIASLLVLTVMPNCVYI